MTQRKNEGMSIVLVGAPGSKKSEVAQEFTKLAKKTLGNFVLIDDIAKTLGEKYDRAFGLHGDYIENLWVAFERYNEEQEYRRDGTPFITVGSIIETMAHGAQNVEILSQGVQTAESEKKVMREMHATTTLSFMFIDTFRYTYGFHLPLAESVVLPGNVEAKDDHYERMIDRNLGVAFQNFGLGLEVLKGTPEQMAAQMLESILKIEEAKEEVVPDEEVAAAVAEGGDDAPVQEAS